MRLDIVSPDSTTDNPSEEEIVEAIAKVYTENIDAVILISDVENNRFMQLPCGGVHIEYCVSPEGPIYSHEDTSRKLAIELFLSYARGDERWRTAVEWKVQIERL